MLSSLEMVSEPSGKTKTLADMIKDGSIITPETPVHTSDDSMELEEYIESLIPEPPAPVSNDWELAGSVENCAFNVAKTMSNDIKDMIENGDYSDILLVVKLHDATYSYPDCILNTSFAWFKSYLGNRILFDTSAFSAGNPQGTAPFWFTIVKDGSDYKLTYVGANHFYNMGTQIDIDFYVR